MALQQRFVNQSTTLPATKKPEDSATTIKGLRQWVRLMAALAWANRKFNRAKSSPYALTRLARRAANAFLPTTATAPRNGSAHGHQQAGRG